MGSDIDRVRRRATIVETAEAVLAIDRRSEDHWPASLAERTPPLGVIKTELSQELHPYEFGSVHR